MARESTFTFRLTADERDMLQRLARYMERTESDTIRVLIRRAAEAENNSDVVLKADWIEDEYKNDNWIFRLVGRGLGDILT